MQIEKLKKAPMTYAVTYWTLGTNDYWESEPHQKIWNGAHMLNNMLDSGEAIVESYQMLQKKELTAAVRRDRLFEDGGQTNGMLRLRNDDDGSK